MSVTPNLCCDETEPRNIHSRDRKIPWKRKRLPTPLFWPGEFHGLCSPWGRKESDTTEQLSLSLFNFNAKRRGLARVQVVN